MASAALASAICASAARAASMDSSVGTDRTFRLTAANWSSISVLATVCAGAAAAASAAATGGVHLDQ